MNELDADLADEDELLAKDTFVAPAPRVAADCGPGAGPTKKACKVRQMRGEDVLSLLAALSSSARFHTVRVSLVLNLCLCV